MILLDVNILVYACAKRTPQHMYCRQFVDEMVNGKSPFGMAPEVLGSMVRVVTNPKIFGALISQEDALTFCEWLLGAPNCVIVRPGARHWGIFARLCRESGATGNLIPDAWLAALAIEHGCEWVSNDTDFGLFPGLRWRKPF